eukprot:gene7949-13840_t
MAIQVTYIDVDDLKEKNAEIVKEVEDSSENELILSDESDFVEGEEMDESEFEELRSNSSYI